MTDTQTKKTGDFCWVELCTPDIQKAQKFYKTLFSWHLEDIPMPDGAHYTMMKVGETPIAGGYQITPELEAQGAVPHWASYVLVDDADNTTKRAKTLGATVYKEPFDVSNMGRMAVLADPTGAVFYLWQPKHGPAVALPKNESGSLGWNELVTPDTKTASQFYSDLFGWKAETQKMPSGKIYTSFFNGETPIGGMLELTDEWNGAPPHWGVYFSVTDLDKTIASAESLSGQVVYEPISAPNVGRFTAITDPQGVHFSVIEFEKR